MPGDAPRHQAGGVNPFAYLDSFPQSRLLVVGDLMLDEYLWGHIERISPEAPVPVLHLVRRECALGGAGNVIRNLRSLGAQVDAIGIVGGDAAGDRVLALLDEIKVGRASVVCDPRRPSTHKARLMSIEHDQQVFRLDEESAVEVQGEIEDHLIALIEERMASAQAVLCSDYQKGLLTNRVLQAVFQSARSHGVPAIVGPKDSHAEKYRGAGILMPNARELAQLAGTRADAEDWLPRAARHIVESLGLEALVVTRGRDGISLFEPGGDSLRRVDIPTVARTVYDVTGAGDTAIATFSLALVAGADREAAANLANVAAGVVVGKRGTASVTVEEIRSRLSEASAKN